MGLCISKKAVPETILGYDSHGNLRETTIRSASGREQRQSAKEVKAELKAMRIKNVKVSHGWSASDAEILRDTIRYA